VAFEWRGDKSATLRINVSARSTDYPPAVFVRSVADNHRRVRHRRRVGPASRSPNAAVVHDIEATRKTLHELKEVGFPDRHPTDFGTGYAVLPRT